MHSFDTDRFKKGFIVLEGIDGSGTTTQMNLLAESLRSQNIPCATTAEPTTSPVGKLIRSALRGEWPAQASTIAWLFAADRNEHLFGENGILQHLQNDEIVISDRYVLSSLAYQGVTCHSDLPWKLNESFPAPGLTLLFSIRPEIALQRINSRLYREIYEILDLQIKIWEMYQRMADKLSQQGWNIVFINAEQSIEDVHDSIQKEVYHFLGLTHLRSFL